MQIYKRLSLLYSNYFIVSGIIATRATIHVQHEPNAAGFALN